MSQKKNPPEPSQPMPLTGIILMIGGGSDDPNVFNYAMFDFRRLVAAPVVILAGVAIMIIAIVKVPKEKE